MKGNGNSRGPSVVLRIPAGFWVRWGRERCCGQLFAELELGAGSGLCGLSR